MNFHHPSRLGSLVQVAVAVFLAQAVDLALLARCSLAADAREELARVEDDYLMADFPAALQKVDALLASGDLEGAALRDAWILKARCEVGLGHRSSAEDAFCQALRVQPTWRPDPDLSTKDEIDAFEQARAQCGAAPWDRAREEPGPIEDESSGSTRVSAGRPWYKNPVVLGVGGALVIGGIVAAASGGGGGGGGDEVPDLPGFPEPPR